MEITYRLTEEEKSIIKHLSEKGGRLTQSDENVECLKKWGKSFSLLCYFNLIEEVPTFSINYFKLTKVGTKLAEKIELSEFVYDPEKN